MSVKLGLAIAMVGAALTCAIVFAAVEDHVTATVSAGLLLVGPAWCYAIAVASDEDDFTEGDRTRALWLRWLPWTFVVAPLVLPNLVVLGLFFRDARLDGGRTPLGWDRMRPGEADRDHHWPE